MISEGHLCFAQPARVRFGKSSSILPLSQVLPIARLCLFEASTPSEQISILSEWYRYVTGGRRILEPIEHTTPLQIAAPPQSPAPMKFLLPSLPEPELFDGLAGALVFLIRTLRRGQLFSML